MAPPRAAARKKPIVASDDSDEASHSPPPKRPRRGTLLSVANGAKADTKPATAQTRRVSSSKPSPQSKKSPSKSPGKPRPIYKPITSFFSNVPRAQAVQPTPSPEKSTASTPLEVDDILDFSDDGGPSKQSAALPVRRGKIGVTAVNDNPSRGSQRFIRTANEVRHTPPPSQSATPSVDNIDRRPWNEKYGPTSLGELAVHKKKIADVRTWLSGVLDGKERKRLLLLKGPAGSGKTTTMSLLSKEMGIHMHEWKNPTNSVSASDGLISATAQFEDFVGRTGAFGSLAFDEPMQDRPQSQPATQTRREKQLILVEEFPNTFTRTSSVVQSFRSSILNYLAASTPSATAFFASKADQEQPVTPIVMIVSETLLSTNTAAADSFTAHRLLGPEILTHPGVTVIEFNPIAPTFMTKALDLMVLKEARKSGRRKTVGPQVIQRLTELGDVRSAVSSLEFLCLRGDDAEGWGAKVNFSKKKGPKDTPITKMEQESLEMVTQRESTLGIFHAVGRVVYNKRSPEDTHQPMPQPPNWFPDRRRPKASEVDVDALINELGTDTMTFIAALHENYVLSCDSGDSEDTLDCVNGCIDALSDADLLSPDRFGSGFGRRSFQGTSADNLRQDEMSFQSSVRGLLYNLPNPVKRIAPPPGVMGMKSKGAGSGGGAASKSSAFVMYYPASLRIWRQQEEVSNLLDMWVSRAQRGELFGSSFGVSKPISTTTGGVDTWRKTASLRPPSEHVASQSGTQTSEDIPAPILLGSGGSARYEMLLERLPYLPTILRRSVISTSATSTIREIRKITSFTGAVSSSAEDDEDDEHENEYLGEVDQWATDKPGAETPKKKKKRVRIESKLGEVESAFPGGAVRKEGMSNVLSDDDIED